MEDLQALWAGWAHSALRNIVSVFLLRNVIVVLQELDCIWGELEVGIALVSEGARILQQKALQIYFFPNRNISVIVILNDHLGHSGNRNARILFTC